MTEAPDCGGCGGAAAEYCDPTPSTSAVRSRHRASATSNSILVTQDVSPWVACCRAASRSPRRSAGCRSAGRGAGAVGVAG
eukprot:scaffold5166_cov100-Isochrysis_galbana.AAC.1